MSDTQKRKRSLHFLKFQSYHQTGIFGFKEQNQDVKRHLDSCPFFSFHFSCLSVIMLTAENCLQKKNYLAYIWYYKSKNNYSKKQIFKHRCLQQAYKMFLYPDLIGKLRPLFEYMIPTKSQEKRWLCKLTVGIFQLLHL